MKKSLSVLVYLFCAIFILVNCTNKELSFIEDVDGLKVDSMAPFYHGVASGDPLENNIYTLPGSNIEGGYGLFSSHTYEKFYVYLKKGKEY